MYRLQLSLKTMNILQLEPSEPAVTRFIDACLGEEGWQNPLVSILADGTARCTFEDEAEKKKVEVEAVRRRDVALLGHAPQQTQPASPHRAEGEESPHPSSPVISFFDDPNARGGGDGGGGNGGGSVASRAPTTMPTLTPFAERYRKVVGAAE